MLKAFRWEVVANESYAELKIENDATIGQQASLFTRSPIGPLAPTCSLEFEYFLTNNANSTVSFAVVLYYIGSGVLLSSDNSKKLAIVLLFQKLSL